MQMKSEERMKKFICVFVSIAMLLLLCACGSNTETEYDGLKIVCTAFPQYDYIRNILGTDEGLTLLLDDGADLHSYEPTAQDIIKIGSADMFVYIGGTSDKWVDGAVASANNPNLKSVAVMDLVNTLEEEYVAGMERERHVHVEAHEGDHSEEDEHIWLSLRNAAEITDKLCETICLIDSANASDYRVNADSYINQLNALDAEYQTVAENSARKTLLFADRFPFRYLTEDYGLTYYAAFAGCSSESEASFETMAFLIDKTTALNLPVVLTIEGSDGSIAKMICEETGAKSSALNSCQSVTYQDIVNGANYLDIMKNNLNVIREALN